MNERTTENETAIRDFIVDQIFGGYPPIEIDAETELLESSVLDSINLVQLIQFLESRFNIEVQDAAVAEHNVRTVARLAKLVDDTLDSAN